MSPKKQRGTATFVASHVLTNVVVVLERILRYLNARQLNKAARVCQTWRELVKREKESRTQMIWNYFTPSANNEAWWEDVQSFILDSPFEPTLVILFCTNTLWSLSVDSRGHRKTRKRRLKLSAFELVIPCLPSQCGFHAVVSGGIIGTDKNMHIEEMDLDCEGAAVLVLGQFPGTEFIVFSTTHVESAELAKFWSDTVNSKPSCMQPLHNKNVKMLNLYCPMSGIDQEVSYSLFRMFDWPLIAGGFVNEKCLRDSQGLFHTTERSCIVSGLAICGEEVQVASVLIRSDIDSEKEVEEIMQRLKDFGLPCKKNKTFGLMYACVGRGFHIYNKHNVESQIFRKHFPRIPLFGFFGNGEIGCVYPPSNQCFGKSQSGSAETAACGGQQDQGDHGGDEGDEEMLGEKLTDAQVKRQAAERKRIELVHKMKHPPKLLHAYTTVMCLVSLP